jgi:hypothetical protein
MRGWLFLLALLIIGAVIAAVVVTCGRRNRRSRRSCRRTCSFSSSSSSSSSTGATGATGTCPCTSVVDSILSGERVPVTYARFGSAESVGSRHWAGRVRDSTLSATATGDSLNWSGYATVQSLGATGIGSVTQVVGSWTVPTVTGPATGISYSVNWVGLDGFTSPTVEQLGTEQDYVEGVPTYFAWFEMFPAPAIEIVGFPVSPGDSISASVTNLGSGVFQLGMRNNTQGVSVVIPTADTTNPDALSSSAEWIVEAPSSGMSILPLAQLSTVDWSGACATVGGVQGSICSPNRDDIALTMIDSNAAPISTPSALTCNCTAFTVSQP